MNKPDLTLSVDGPGKADARPKSNASLVNSVSFHDEFVSAGGILAIPAKRSTRLWSFFTQVVKVTRNRVGIVFKAHPNIIADRHFPHGFAFHRTANMSAHLSDNFPKG